MAADTSASLGFSITDTGHASKPSRIDDEVFFLFEQLRAPVLRYLLSFGILVPDAEEVLQDVFLKLFQHLRQANPAPIFRVGFSGSRITKL